MVTPGGTLQTTVVTQWIFIATLRGRLCFEPHFADKEMEARPDEVNSRKLRSLGEAKSGTNKAHAPN